MLDPIGIGRSRQRAQPTELEERVGEDEARFVVVRRRAHRVDQRTVASSAR